MGRIQVLDWLVVNKIAAGEVIERPASVVKELVENSVDAEASQIEIHLEDGGKRLIRVNDDGHGIHPEDFSTAFLNHATSKISNVEDIFSIHTMGFRGEALPSIASISKITLRSRISEDTTGRKVVVKQGVCSEIQEEGMSCGTQIDVEDLFYNTPVRQKFLKASKTELSYISKMVSLLALAHEHCGFTLIHNQKQLFKIPKNMEIRERIEILFGKELIEESLPVDVTAEDIQLRAFIGKPSVAKPKASQVYFFLNHRPIKDKSLAQAFREAYGEFLAPNRFPHGFIFLDMKPELVDVNVHPTKSEVRFQHSGKIFSFLLNQFKETLRSSNLAPAVKIPLNSLPPFFKNSLKTLASSETEKILPFQEIEALPPQKEALPEILLTPPSNTGSFRAPPLVNTNLLNASPKGPLYPTGTHSAPSMAPSLDYPSGTHTKLSSPPLSQTENLRFIENQPPLRSNTSEIEAFSEPEHSAWNPWGKVFQLHNSYIVEETKNGFHVIDQHALHERILAFKFQDILKNTEKVSQRLLIPETLDLNKADFLLLVDQQNTLAEFGIEIDVFGESAVSVNAVPLLLKDAPLREIMQAIVTELRENGEIRQSVEKFREAIIHMMACKAAVKYGQKLNERELISLLKARFTVEHTHNCPHGRPTTLHFSREDLDRQFHRH